MMEIHEEIVDKKLYFKCLVFMFLNKCFISANFMDTLGSKEDLIKLFSWKSSFDGINNMPSPRKL